MTNAQQKGACFVAGDAAPKPVSSVLNYRADIDGLRALAILPVVTYHAFPTLLPGGFTGVDIFFVISGFLISAILFADLERDQMTLHGFYARRIRRIFPALLLILLVSLSLGWLILLPGELAQLGKHTAAGAGFILNFILWNEVGYFDTAAELKPLLHLWSLSIEEQFYIVWPLFLGVVWRFRQYVPVFHALLIACLTSFSLNILEIWGDPSGLFYSPQTRFWELAFGAVLAWIIYQKRAISQLPARTKNTLSFVGLALIGLSFYCLGKTAVFPGFLALLPVLGTSLIVAAGPSALPNANVLSRPALVWVGRISFPLYLWHWPLLAFANILEDGSPHAAVRLGLVALAVVLSWLTVEWVEKPIRQGPLSVSLVSGLAIGLLLVGSLGYWTHQKAVHATSMINFGGIQRAVDDWEYPGALQRYNTGSHVFLRHPNREDINTLFIGDSNMEMYSSRTDELLKTDAGPVNGAIFATRGGCLPILNVVYDEARQPCANLMQGAFDLAAADETVRNVVIAAQWNGYFSTGYGLQGEYGLHGKDTQQALQSLSQSVRLLASQGKHVFVILNIPTGKEFDPKWLVSRGLRNFPRFTETRAGGSPRSAIDEQFGVFQDSIRKLAEAAGATVIDPMDYVCTYEYCPSVDATGEPMYKDGYHLRASYVRRNAHFIDSTLKLQR